MNGPEKRVYACFLRTHVPLLQSVQRDISRKVSCVRMTQDYAVLSLPELTDKELATVLGGNGAGAAEMSRAVGLGNAAELGRSAVSAYGGAGVTTFAGVNLAP